MQTRFCATMRSPAFSINAFTAPVRLRAVASGLMIEKVRSIGMTSSFGGRGKLKFAGLYRRHRCAASDPPTWRGLALDDDDFHEGEGNLKQLSRCVQLPSN